MTKMFSCPPREPGPSRLRWSQHQAAILVPLVRDIRAFPKVVSKSDVLPYLFRSLHASEPSTRLDEKVRPVTCSDVLQRVVRGTSCRHNSSTLQDVFERLGPYGGSVGSGV